MANKEILMCVLNNLFIFGLQIINTTKDIISFVNENAVGIILSCLILLSILWYFFHNRKIMRDYKAENGNNIKKYETKFCSEDGDKGKHRKIYLINTESVPKTYQWIVDGYTSRQLGYPDPSQQNTFSKKDSDYKMKNRIKIYNIISDIGYMVGLIKDIRN